MTRTQVTVVEVFCLLLPGVGQSAMQSAALIIEGICTCRREIAVVTATMYLSPCQNRFVAFKSICQSSVVPVALLALVCLTQLRTSNVPYVS